MHKGGVILIVNYIAHADTCGNSSSSIINHILLWGTTSQHKNHKMLLLRATSPTMRRAFACFFSLLHFIWSNMQQEFVFSFTTIVQKIWNLLTVCKNCLVLSHPFTISNFMNPSEQKSPDLQP